MNILLTNDDGIFGQGLQTFYHELKKIGKVTVVAPDRERSSIGHGITLAYPIWYKRVYQLKRFFGYAVSGTPADCVKLGIRVILRKQPDLVVSGINWGPNEGCSVFYSGTVAGAREGALMGIPAMAFSLAAFENPLFGPAAKCGAKLLKALLKCPLKKGSFFNINIPNARKIRGVKFTRQGLVPIHGHFQKRVNPNLQEYFWMTGRVPRQKNDLGVDTYALRKDYATVTPVHCDLTDYELLDRIKSTKI